MRIVGFLCALAALALAACSGDETTASTTSSSSSATGASSTSGGTGGGMGGGGTGGSSTGGAGGAGGEGGAGGGSAMGEAAIIINEMNARPPINTDAWLEIVNAGNAEFDLNGYKLADTDPATPMSPDTAEAMIFPADAIIPAGGYILIRLDQDNAPNPPVKGVDCIPAAPPGTVCYDAGWKISFTGEQIFFLDATNTVVSMAEYPDPAVVIPTPVEGETWARVPDKTGKFVVGTPTPGAANSAL
jgi:hypothetical protein